MKTWIIENVKKAIAAAVAFGAVLMEVIRQAVEWVGK